MMNDKIRLAADVLAALGMGVGSHTFEAAAAQPQRDEFLRSAFLAGVKRTGLKETMEGLLKAVRAELDKSGGRLEPGTAAMLELLEDEDVITPADRTAAAAFMTKGEVSASMKYPDLLAVIERVWSPAYEPRTALTMWLAALQPGSTVEAARRLADRTDADAVSMGMLCEYANNLPALQVLVGRMSPEALVRNCEVVHQKIGEKPGQSKGVMESTLLVLLNRIAETEGPAMKMGVAWVDGLLERGDVARRLDAGFAQFARFLQLTGRLDDPRLLNAMLEEGLESIDKRQLAQMLESGLPASRPMPEGRNRVARTVHLLEKADLEQIAIIAPYMSDADRVDFVRNQLPYRLQRVGFVETGSCVGENILSVLHRAGFDLGAPINDKGERLHEGGGVPSMGSSKKYVFTALHALGAYPPDLRMGGLGPLHYAAFHNDGPTIEVLAKRGYDINDAGDGNEEAPLVTALKYNNPIAVRALIALGADVGVKAKSGASLLQIAKDDEMKRLIRAARTGASVVRGMGGPEGSAPMKRVSSDPTVL